jgi:predicted CoA-binding protein
MPDLDRPLELLRDARTIAVVGISSLPEKPSNYVTRYLLAAGYTIYLVNPDEREVFGMPVYDRVQDLPEPVDIVDVFRRPHAVQPVVEDAIAAGARTVWMQLGIVNEEAAHSARSAGLEVVMNRCTKVDHGRLQLMGLAPRF